MKIRTTLILLALTLAGPAIAQDDEDRAREIEAREAEFAERMRLAEERLAEAAQRVAELSSERLGSMNEARRFAFEFSNKPRLGVNIEPMGDGDPVEGVAILSVSPGSAADDAGLRAGDVITAVNRVLVRNLRDLAAIAENNRILFLLVQRGDRSLMLQIR